MDPYLAKLIGRTEPPQEQQEQPRQRPPGVLLWYRKGKRTFFLIRGPLTPDHRRLLDLNMQALHEGAPVPVGTAAPEALRTESAS